MRLKIGKKTGLRKFGMPELRSFRPCYDPSRHLPENWRGSAVDILRNESIPFEDRLWVVCRSELVSERVVRLFAVWSYRQTLIHTPNQDRRCIEAANVGERYANGQATLAELSAARSAAWSAAAWSAAWSAAESAAWSAARSAAESAAWSAARSAQKDKLIEMVLAEGRERLAKKKAR